MEQFKLKVGRCFALISNHFGGFDLFVTGRRHFLLSERSLSFNNVMITLTSARSSTRTVELPLYFSQIYVGQWIRMEHLSSTMQLASTISLHYFSVILKVPCLKAVLL